MRFRARALLLGVAAVLPTVAATCGGPSRLDAGRLERELPAAVVADHPDVVTDVSCPSPIKREVGLVVECQASISATPVTLTVTQTDDNGGVRVELDRPLLDIDKVSSELAARLTKDVGVATSVTCAGPPVVVLSVGATISCDATDPSNRTRTFVATIADESGALDVKVS